MPGLLIHGARQVLTLRGPAGPRRGSALRNLAIIEDGSILIEDGRIREVGPTSRIENLAVARQARQISARGRVVMPGFVDCHMRLISGAGGPAGSLRQTPAWRIDSDASAMLRRCLRYGTTTLEAKACEGLDEASASKVLRVLSGLAKQQAVDLISTYCGGVRVPEDWAGTTNGYIERLMTKSLPLIHEKALANFVAVSCDRSVFDEAQSRRLLEAAARLGFAVKIQAGGEGAAALAVECDSVTMEHLENLPIGEVDRLAESESIAVLMPAHGFHRPEVGYAPARELITRGAAVALASGYDRVTSPSFSMPITIELACRRLAMAPSEAIMAATVNAAYAVGRGNSTGSIEPGKNANLLILETPDFRDLVYETGVNPVGITIVRGEVACQNSVHYGAAAAATSGI